MKLSGNRLRSPELNVLGTRRPGRFSILRRRMIVIVSPWENQRLHKYHQE